MSKTRQAAMATGFASLGAVDAPVLVREQAFDRVREAIITGQFPPGTRLIERELCEALGVSRTSIREVLRRLEAEKLVLVEPRKGPTVARVTKAQAEEIYQIRAYLEGLLIRRFVERASGPDIVKLDELARRFFAVASDGDVPRSVGVMVEFYDFISSVVEADVLRDILGQLTARVSYLRATSMSEPGRMANSIEEIAEIVEAIKRRDAQAAENAAVSHVKSAARTALARLSD